MHVKGRRSPRLRSAYRLLFTSDSSHASFRELELAQKGYSVQSRIVLNCL